MMTNGAHPVTNVHKGIFNQVMGLRFALRVRQGITRIRKDKQNASCAYLAFIQFRECLSVEYAYLAFIQKK